MTAIADIIVNQSANEQQKSELQISQNLNTHTKSSSEGISFAQMLDNFRNDKEVVENKESSAYKPEETKVVEKSEEKIEEKNEKSSEIVEKNDEKQNSKIDSTEKEENVKNVSSTKDFSTEKDKFVSKESKNKVEKNQKSEKNQSKVKSNEEKINADYERLSQILENQNEQIDSKTQVVGENVKIKNPNEKQNEYVDSFEELTKVGEVSDDLEIKNYSDKKSDVKVSKLDKDGKIVVKDLRSEKPEKEDNQIKTKVDAKFETKVEINDKNTATLTMDLNNQNVENDILSLNNQTASSDGSNFQAMLSNQLQESAPEFVKAGSIILKDNDKGTINLVLHPDDLGSVKINLSLDGKTLSAHITVNTKEALEVFKDNAQTLREAFAQNGFDTSNFDVSYNNQSGNNSQNFENQFDGTEFIAKHAYQDYADNISDNFIQNENYFENFSEYSVNIIA